MKSVIQVFTKPKKTFVQYLQNDPEKFFIFLVATSGIINSLDSSAGKELGDRMSLGSILMRSLFVGGLLGIVWFYISCFFVKIAGQILGGRGDIGQIRYAMAFGLIPYLFTSFSWFFLILIGGHSVFTSNPSDAASLFMILHILIVIVFSGWTIFTLSHCMSVVQGFSPLKGFFNILLGYLLPYAIFFVIGLMLASTRS